MVNWFKEAVEKKKPNKLNGWTKTGSTTTRRRRALSSRPKNWKLKTRYRSVARALQSLANVTKDKRTKEVAKRDANYFFKKLR